jgi:hypothetical protein
VVKAWISLNFDDEFGDLADQAPTMENRTKTINGA